MKPGGSTCARVGVQTKEEGFGETILSDSDCPDIAERVDPANAHLHHRNLMIQRYGHGSTMFKIFHPMSHNPPKPARKSNQVMSAKVEKKNMPPDPFIPSHQCQP